MRKLIAILNVIAWSGFWAFGYLALSADAADTTHIMVAGLLAVAGAAVGLFTYLQLVRHSEATGYAKPRNRVPEHLRENEEGAT
jgi:hypothetical protein